MNIQIYSEASKFIKQMSKYIFGFTVIVWTNIQINWESKNWPIYSWILVKSKKWMNEYQNILSCIIVMKIYPVIMMKTVRYFYVLGNNMTLIMKISLRLKRNLMLNKWTKYGCELYEHIKLNYLKLLIVKFSLNL